MQAELTAASRHEHLVLYDPAAIPADTPVDPDLRAQDPSLLPEPAMRQLAAQGEALVVRIPGEDCEARFRLYVDEDPPEPIRSRGQVLFSGARLRVPSGLLRADGLEFLSRAGETRQHAAPEDASVPPGLYVLEVINLMAWKAANRLAEARRGLGRRHRVVHVLVAFYTWLGILMFPANLLLGPFVVIWTWRSMGWQRAAAAVAVIVAVDALVLAGFWLLDALRRRSPGLFLVAEAEAVFEAANPDIVVVLRSSEHAGDPGPAAYAEVRAVG